VTVTCQESPSIATLFRRHRAPMPDGIPHAIRLWVLGLLILLTPAAARAGITIHYSGTAKSPGAVKAILHHAAAFGRQHHWKIKMVSGGLVLYPAPWCEPLDIVFEGTKLKPDFVKTQFAGPRVHRDIVQLLRQIQPMAAKLNVDDEGKYWETSDYQQLIDNMNEIKRMIKTIENRRPNVKGPLRLPNGRIIDLYQQ
jgi:hypothetical protein